nr:MAG TPA: hypothetical protein [Caudoviricetes sp.]
MFHYFLLLYRVKFSRIRKKKKERVANYTFR